jgi:predicted  nucleic acid-binding Zn-ribbon protein
MHPQLEILLQIQDLRAQHRDLGQREGSRQVEEEQFQVDIEKALASLDEKIDEMETQLDRAVRDRYRRLASGTGKAVVPVIQGTCYGCFVSIPTSVASAAAGNRSLRHCDNCGRFLYVLS